MDLNLTTPTVLLSTVSLILLAYTQRFIAIVKVIRELIEQYKSTQYSYLLDEIDSLKFRIYLIRNMQICGALSTLSAILSIFFMFFHLSMQAKYLFGISLVLLIISLIFSTIEICVSTEAITHELRTIDKD